MPRQSASMDAKMMKFMSPRGRGRTTRALMDYADPSSAAERTAVENARGRLLQVGTHARAPDAPIPTAYGIAGSVAIPMAIAGMPGPLTALGAIAGLHTLVSGISHVRNSYLRDQIKKETMAEIDAIRANLAQRLVGAERAYGVTPHARVGQLLRAPPARGVRMVPNPARVLRADPPGGLGGWTYD
jgi:hypothetical protein